MDTSQIHVPPGINFPRIPPQGFLVRERDESYTLQLDLT